MLRLCWTVCLLPLDHTFLDIRVLDLFVLLFSLLAQGLAPRRATSRAQAMYGRVMNPQIGCSGPGQEEQVNGHSQEKLVYAACYDFVPFLGEELIRERK